MAFRDDNEALRAKVDGLSADLAEAEGVIAKLRGERGDDDSAPEREATEWSSFLGTERKLTSAVELPHEIDTEGYEAIGALLAERFGHNAAQVGRQLSAPGFSLSFGDGVTKIRLTTDWTGVPSGTVVGTGVLGVLGTLVPASLAHDWLHMTPLQIAAVAAVAFGVAAVGGGVGLRWRARRQIEREARAHRGAFERILEIAEQHRVGGPRVRIELTTDRGDAPDEVEAATSRAIAERAGRS